MTGRIHNVATVFPVASIPPIDEIRRQRRRSILREFALTTSTHGVPGIARGESIHNRVFWSVSTSVFTGIMLYFVITSIRDYFEYPTKTSVDITVDWPIPFPAFTLCNYCPVRRDLFMASFLNYWNTISSTNSSPSNYVYTADSIANFREFMQIQINSNQTADDYFFSLSAMLISCKFNNVPCSTSDFISFESSQYGRCYTFNAKIKNLSDDSVRNSNTGGGNGILQLSLYVHSHQYVPYLVDGMGMVAMVHDNQQLPLIDIVGMGMEAGHKHKLSYLRKTTSFMPAPFTTCTENIPPAMQAMFNLYQNADYRYSQSICYSNCVQTYTYAQCGCVDPNQWSIRSVVLFGTNTVINAPLCNYSDPCYPDAADRLMNNASIWTVWCKDCNQECTATSFRITASSIFAPLEWMMDGIRQFVENSSIPLPSNWSTDWQTYIQSNYLAVDVVQESIQTEKLTQDGSLGGVDLLSNVGGQSSLWIGISFLSLMELAEMLYRLIHSQFQLMRIRARAKLLQQPPPYEKKPIPFN